MGLLRPKQRARRSLAEQNSRAFSYYNKRGLDNRNLGRRQPEAPAPQSQEGRRRVLSTLILILIVGLLGYSLLLEPSPRVRVIQSDQAAYATQEKYQEGISAIWREQLGNRLKLTVNSAQIEQKILNKYPELAEVDISLPVAGKRPLVVLTPHRVALSITNRQGTFYANSQGKILASANELDVLNRQDNFKEVVDQSGLELAPGTYVLSESNVETVLSLVAGLEQSGQKVAGLVLPPVINELDIRLEGKAYILKFNLVEDPEQGVGAFVAFLIASKGQTQPQEYVDLRVPSKAFYR